MALTYPLPQIIAAEYVDAPDWNALVDSINFLANPPACRVHHSAVQAIASNTVTTVAFNSERYDTAGMHDLAVNNSRITAPVAGLYLLGCHVQFDVNGTGARTVYMRLNGGSIIAGVEGAPNPSGGNASTVSLVTEYKLAAGDYVEVRVVQISGVSLNLLVSSPMAPEFWARWVGKGA